MKSSEYINESVELLKTLIEIPSFSREEEHTAACIQQFMRISGIEAHRNMNNVWSHNLHFDPELPTILLNSHHDTVRPNDRWTSDPHKAIDSDGKITGLGSNDAGGALVSLLAVFRKFYFRQDLSFNLVYAATAEEEISGLNGLESLVPLLPRLDFAIVGEPTKMDLAVAERGLLVLDCTTHGEAGHAANGVGKNAILEAFEDINWFRTYEFERKSEMLGDIKMTTTVINAGKQHNVIPDSCSFTVDVRTTEQYTNEEVLEIVREHVKSDVAPRSVRLNSSYAPMDHPLVIAALNAGCNPYGSATCSDQAVLNFPSVKIGPGDSNRSHTADEFIFLEEIHTGVDIYGQILENLDQELKKDHYETLEGRYPA